MLRQWSHHDIPICIKLETFYNSLTPSSINMLDASSRWALLCKSFNKGFELMESITINTYQWQTIKATLTPTKRPIIVHELSETIALADQVDQIHKNNENLDGTWRVICETTQCFYRNNRGNMCLLEVQTCLKIVILILFQ